MKNGSPTPTKCVQKSEVLPWLKKILNTASFHVWQLCHCQVQEKVNANVNNFVLSKTKMSFLYLKVISNSVYLIYLIFLVLSLLPSQE